MGSMVIYFKERWEPLFQMVKDSKACKLTKFEGFKNNFHHRKAIFLL